MFGRLKKARETFRDDLTKTSILLDIEMHKANGGGSKFLLDPSLRSELATDPDWIGVHQSSFKAGELMGTINGVKVYASTDSDD